MRVEDPIIVVAGLPGSGKSTVMSKAGSGHVEFDDINNGDGGPLTEQLLRAKRIVQSGGRVAINDSLFCTAGWQGGIERFFGQPIHWISLSNDPTQCKINSWMRHLTQRRSPEFEFQLIDELSAVYRPKGRIEPVWINPTGIDASALPNIQHRGSPIVPQHPFPF
jgi:hypothetical protein